MFVFAWAAVDEVVKACCGNDLDVANRYYTLLMLAAMFVLLITIVAHVPGAPRPVVQLPYVIVENVANKGFFVQEQQDWSRMVGTSEMNGKSFPVRVYRKGVQSWEGIVTLSISTVSTCFVYDAIESEEWQWQVGDIIQNGCKMTGEWRFNDFWLPVSSWSGEIPVKQIIHELKAEPTTLDRSVPVIVKIPAGPSAKKRWFPSFIEAVEHLENPANHYKSYKFSGDKPIHEWLHDDKYALREYDLDRCDFGLGIETLTFVNVGEAITALNASRPDLCRTGVCVVGTTCDGSFLLVREDQRHVAKEIFKQLKQIAH